MTSLSLSALGAAACEAISDAADWLEAQEQRFYLLPCRSSPADFDEHFKPFLELSLVCYLLTRERHSKAQAAWHSWAEHLARRLFDHLEWEGLIEMFRVCAEGTLGLAAYPFLGLASGQRSRFHSEAEAHIDHAYARSQERSPMREMDYQFTRHLFGSTCAGPSVSEQIRATVLHSPPDPLLMDTDTLYDVTHIIFYGTLFGANPNIFKKPTSNWLRENLGAMALARFLMDDADLGAELLLCRIYLGDPVDQLMIEGIERLLWARLASGSFKGPAEWAHGRDAFRDDYHTTLVAVVTLAEFALMVDRLGGRV